VDSGSVYGGTVSFGCARCLLKERDELRAECVNMSEEFGLPPTIRPAEGEIRRMLDDRRALRARVELLETALRRVLADPWCNDSRDRAREALG
jgi:hypothetical protein